MLLLPALLLPALLLPFEGTATAKKGAPLPPEELDALESVVKRMAEAGPAGLPALYVEALATVDLGLDDKCRKAVQGASAGAGDVRSMAALNVLESCKFPLWEPFGRAANELGGLWADARFVKACDEKGKDAVFTGALSSLRAELEPGHYALLRQLLPPLRERLKADGSPRARETWKAMERALPRLAVQLVALDREAHPRPAGDGDPPGFERPLPAGRGELRRAGAPLVSVVRGGVLLEGSDVGRVEALLRKQDVESFTIAPLVKGLERWRKEFGTHHPSLPARERAILRPDPETRFAILARLLHTLSGAGFPDVDFAVPLRDRSFHRVRWSGHPGAPLVLALRPEPTRVDFDEEPAARGTASAAPPAAPTRPAAAPPASGEPDLGVEPAEFVVRSRTGAEMKVPDVDGKPDEAALRKALAWLRKGAGPLLPLSVHDDVPYRRLLWTLEVARDSGFPTPRLDVEVPAEPPAAPASPATPASAKPAGPVAAAAPPSSPAPPPPTAPPGSGAGDLGDLTALGLVDDKSPKPVVDVEPVKVDGGLGTETVTKVVQANLGALRTCYAAGVARDKRLAGHLVLQLLVSGGGNVSKAFVSSSTLKIGSIEECVVKAAQGFAFPMPDNGVAVIVTAPFAFHMSRP